jgi:hypothetical protein
MMSNAPIRSRNPTISPSRPIFTANCSNNKQMRITSGFLESEFDHFGGVSG